MKNIAVINGIGLRAPAFRPLVDGASAFASALAFARGSFPVSRTMLFLSVPVLVAAAVAPSSGNRWTVSDLLEEMQRRGKGMRGRLLLLR